MEDKILEIVNDLGVADSKRSYLTKAKELVEQGFSEEQALTSLKEVSKLAFNSLGLEEEA